MHASSFCPGYPRQLAHKLFNCNMLTGMIIKTKISMLLRGNFCKLPAQGDVLILYHFILMQDENKSWNNLFPLGKKPLSPTTCIILILFKGDKKLHRSNVLNYEKSLKAFVSRKVEFLQFLQNWINNVSVGQKTSSFVWH